jgi:SagB-type dehydrogenase family enzyme
MSRENQPLGADARWVLNPDCAIFAAQAGAVATVIVPSSHAELVLENAIGLELLRYSTGPRSRAELSSFLSAAGIAADAAELIFSELIEAEVLLPADAPDRGATWRAYGWNEARLLQVWSRDERFLDEGTMHQATRAETLRSYRRDAPQPLRRETSGGAELALPEPPPLREAALVDLLKARRTTRRYSGEATDLASLATLLETALRAPAASHEAFTADVQPSLATFIPSRFLAFDLLVVAQRVAGLQAGIYRYQPRARSLAPVASLENATAADALLERLVWGQTMPRGGAFAIVVAIDFPRYMWLYRYGRAYRNLIISLGELGQLLLLGGQAIGLKSCMTPAIRDSFADEMLGLESPDSQAHYYLGFGK